MVGIGYSNENRIVTWSVVNQEKEIQFKNEYEKSRRDNDKTIYLYIIDVPSLTLMWRVCMWKMYNIINKTIVIEKHFKLSTQLNLKTVALVCSSMFY